MEKNMKDKLIQSYNFLNTVSVVGHSNVLAMSNAINIIYNLVKDLEQEEQLKQQEIESVIEIDNTKNEIQNTKDEKKGDKT
jgi:DNA-binding protein H-NS